MLPVIINDLSIKTMFYFLRYTPSTDCHTTLFHKLLRQRMFIATAVKSLLIRSTDYAATVHNLFSASAVGANNWLILDELSKVLILSHTLLPTHPAGWMP
ncbi:MULTISPECIES: hypothetical protein [Enterobacterales]|uniref:hypothetical protein n=1 Tax=Enterobacterales TaxID=91347 RepID=UPI002EDB3B4B